MLIAVDPHSGVPVYRQVMDQIKLHVASGALAPGEELPSTRALSTELGVNPMTISKAYSYLEREDVVERRPGRPLIVKPFASNEQAQQSKLAELRRHLAPIAALVPQLGIERQMAVSLFGDLIAAEERPASEPPGTADQVTGTAAEEPGMRTETEGASDQDRREESRPTDSSAAGDGRGEHDV